MDIGNIARASPPAGSALQGRQDSVSAAPVAATELTAAKAVQQAGATPNDAVKLDFRDDAAAAAKRQAAVQSFIRARNEYDAKSREVVYRAVDTRTGQVVRQFPDDLALKLRAFVRNVAEKQAEEPKPTLQASA